MYHVYIFSVVVNIVKPGYTYILCCCIKTGYSGFNWLQHIKGVICIFYAVEYIIKLGYCGYNWLQGVTITCIFSVVNIVKPGYTKL